MTTEELAQQGALLTPLCPILFTYQRNPIMDFHNHTLNQQESEERRIMSLNEETCWNDPSFCEYWDEVYAIVEEEYGVPDEGWQLDIILECYQNESSVNDAVADIHDGYDPTPQTSYDFFH